MKLEIRTLTPLWTGGAEAGKVDRIHETGILGSLRWWYETIVRGLGGKACDPSRSKCGFDTEKYDKSKAGDERMRLRDAGLCDVCQVFGATGWQRRFRLIVQDRTKPDGKVSSKIEIEHSYTDKYGKQKTRTSTWYFPSDSKEKPRSGQITIQIQSLAQDFSAQIIAGLIQFIADWSAIGARAQMGFGVVEPVDGRIDTNPLYDWLSALAGSETSPTLPSLRNVFFARIAPKNGAVFTEQDTFNLKYDLRQLFAKDKCLRHFIMGTTKDGRMAAKVKMSRPYGDGLMRVWGWVPEEADVYRGSWNRNTVVDAIYQHLSANYNLRVWREMDSPRDTDVPNNGDARAFLRSLLAIEEEDDAA